MLNINNLRNFGESAKRAVNIASNKTQALAQANKAKNAGMTAMNNVQPLLNLAQQFMSKGQQAQPIQIPDHSGKWRK